MFSFSLDKLFYSLEFSEVVLTESSNECSVPLPDYSSIIEELRNHRQEIKKLHQGCAAPGPDLEGFTFISLPPPPPKFNFFYYIYCLNFIFSQSVSLFVPSFCSSYSLKVAACFMTSWQAGPLTTKGIGPFFFQSSICFISHEIGDDCQLCLGCFSLPEVFTRNIFQTSIS